ncbi:hypothetical protein AB0F43_11005 [Kribbella sp. NPDC023972]|uniref:hypothetical protein n=1 Tax=Kribbella sp. NPDC023972 TaxID=3154795 RepID=UPI0033FCFB1F
MSITQLSAAKITALTRTTLALDADSGSAADPEILAASLRRAASFLCPVPPADLIDAVRDVFGPLYEGQAPLRELIAIELENLLGIGDLLELRSPGVRAGRLIYLGPPTFVARHPGHYLLLGVRAEGRPLVEGEAAAGIQVHGHVRTLALPVESGPALLKEFGLHELRSDRWLRHPAAIPSSQHLSNVMARLDVALASGAVQGLEILDPTRPVRYYAGRWRQLEPTDTGDFLGRRPQAYGAAAWCFVRVHDGQPTALLDLPVDTGALPRDEAWRLQAAIDAERRAPQVYRLSAEEHGGSVLDLFSPIPSWVERSLSFAGDPLERRRGALLSYRLPAAAVTSAEQLLTNMLWMQPIGQEGTA